MIQSIMRRSAANVVTLMSGGAAVVAMMIEPGKAAIALLILGQILDFIDGWLARRLGTATAFGAALDWSVDVGVALTLVGVSGQVWMLLVLAPLYAWAARGRGRETAPCTSRQPLTRAIHWFVARVRRFSGRSLVVMLVILGML